MFINGVVAGLYISMTSLLWLMDIYEPNKIIFNNNNVFFNDLSALLFYIGDEESVSDSNVADKINIYIHVLCAIEATL